jgi:hypothetical protein
LWCHLASAGAHKAMTVAAMRSALMVCSVFPLGTNPPNKQVFLDWNQRRRPQICDLGHITVMAAKPYWGCELPSGLVPKIG